MRFYVRLALFLFYCFPLQAQLVQNQGITSPLHQANQGKILFTSREIPPADLQPTDFLIRSPLTNRNNLFMTVFLANSLTNYLHALAPTLSADSLTKVGNYQFSFFVDHQLIYQTNLHPGAPYARIKNEETVISKPLIDNQHEGRWWSQSAWNRFMNQGGDQALTEGEHLFTLEIRPYLNLSQVLVGPILAQGEVQLDVKRKPTFNLDTVRLTAPQPYPGLHVSTDSFDTRRIKELKGNIEAGVFKHISSIVVLKQGRILLEEYFNGANRSTLHDVRSVGKSFASTLTGIAQAKGYVHENQTLREFYDLKSFSHYSEAKAGTTLHELLTMSSAFDGDDDNMDSPGNEEYMYPEPNWVTFTLNLPVLPTKYQGKWHYFTAGVVLLGDILNKRVPQNLETYAKNKLFDPLGIRQYRWPYTPQKVVSTAGGIQLKALDLAKYGLLYKNKGMWQGRQVVSKAWVAKTFTKHQAIPGRSQEYYGYLFWNKTYTVQGKRLETYYCTGNGGNKIFVFTDQPLVVVVTATAYNTSYAHAQVDRLMQEYLLPAVLK